MKTYLAKVQENKRTKQLMVMLSKKKLEVLKKKKAKFCKINEKDLVF